MLTSKICWSMRSTAISRLFSSARFTASSSVSDTRGSARIGLNRKRNGRRGLAGYGLACHEEIRRQLQSALRRRRNRHHERNKGRREDVFHIREDYDKTAPKVSRSRVWDRFSHLWTGEKTMTPSGGADLLHQRHLRAACCRSAIRRRRCCDHLGGDPRVAQVTRVKTISRIRRCLRRPWIAHQIDHEHVA